MPVISKRTHCANGHALTVGNVMPSGRCRECAKIAQRKARSTIHLTAEPTQLDRIEAKLDELLTRDTRKE